jgi:hypothetical protein
MGRPPCGCQFGPLHGSTWRTLSLRSCDGTMDNDRPGLSYHNTPAWAASTYIVPHLLAGLVDTVTSSAGVGAGVGAGVDAGVGSGVGDSVAEPEGTVAESTAGNPLGPGVCGVEPLRVPVGPGARVAAPGPAPTSSVLQRVRLSVIPPGCNVGWHVDYSGTEAAGPMRMHVPVMCSKGFGMVRGGMRV